MIRLNFEAPFQKFQKYFERRTVRKKPISPLLGTKKALAEAKAAKMTTASPGSNTTYRTPNLGEIRDYVFGEHKLYFLK